MLEQYSGKQVKVGCNHYLLGYLEWNGILTPTRDGLYEVEGCEMNDEDVISILISDDNRITITVRE